MRVFIYFILVFGLVYSCNTKEVENNTTETTDGAKKTYLEQEEITYEEVDEITPVTEETSEYEEVVKKIEILVPQDDYIIPIAVEGKVEFSVDDKNTDIKLYEPYHLENGGKIVIKNSSSNIYLRIVKDGKTIKYQLLPEPEKKYKYPLTDLITQKQDSHEKSEESEINKLFSMFSVSHEEKYRIGNMVFGEKSSTTRSSKNNDIRIKKIEVINGYPLKIDFSNFIDSLDINDNEFNVLVKEYYSPNRIILDKKIKATYFTINDTSNNSLYLNWDIEINYISSSKKIKGTIQQIHLINGERELLDQLRDKAIDESKTDESIYQIIFIDNLRSRGLISNALYYLDLFIETNNNKKLINYRQHNINN